MSGLDMVTREEKENVSGSEETENGEDSPSEDYSRTPSPLDNLVFDPNFVCNITEVDDQPTRITRSKRCKSVGDLYEKAIAAQFARKSVVSQATSTAGASNTLTQITQPLSKKSTPKTSKMDPEIRQAFKEMSDSFKQVGLQAKQNSTSFFR